MTTNRVAALLLAAALTSPTAAAAPQPYRDEARGFAMVIPDGWSDPKGGAMTESGDHAVRCTVTAQPAKQTAGMTQEDVNAMVSRSYTKDVWEHQFFTGGATGAITESGITKMEQYDAPWARGTVTYTGSNLAKFGTILLMAPGKIASVTCVGEPAGFDANFSGITTILNYLRPA